MTLWKYDADQRDPLARLRIPVTSMRPLYSYLAAFHKESVHRPTEKETAMLVSFIEERKQNQYTGAERGRMSALPFDLNPGINTIVFHKYATADWGYRRRGWQIGSSFTPPSPHVATRFLGPLTLEQVMDLIQQGTNGTPEQSWLDWKEAHPEVFGA